VVEQVVTTHQVALVEQVVVVQDHQTQAQHLEQQTLVAVVVLLVQAQAVTSQVVLVALV
jgi:hypothetical protein